MLIKVIAQLPETYMKYREMWISKDAIVCFYDFNENGKEQTCIRLKDGNVVVTESAIAHDIEKIIISSGVKKVTIGG